MAEERDKAVTDLLMQLVSDLLSIALPTQTFQHPLSHILRSEVTLEASATSAIVSARKKRGYTITASRSYFTLVIQCILSLG